MAKEPISVEELDHRDEHARLRGDRYKMLGFYVVRLLLKDTFNREDIEAAAIDMSLIECDMETGKIQPGLYLKEL